MESVLLKGCSDGMSLAWLWLSSFAVYLTQTFRV